MQESPQAVSWDHSTITADLDSIRKDVMLLFRQNAQLALDNSQLQERVRLLESERIQSTPSAKRGKIDVETGDLDMRCEVEGCKNTKHSNQHRVAHCNKHKKIAESERKKKYTLKKLAPAVADW